MFVSAATIKIAIRFVIIKMKILILLTTIFFISCNNSDDDYITFSDLNGEWWTERCNQYLGECSFTQEIDIEDCSSSEYFYVKFEDDLQTDCRTDNNPECNPNDTGKVTLNDNYMTICADQWEDEDDRCLEGEIEINEDSFEWIIIDEIEEGCTRQSRLLAFRKN